jgi:hypothetical protein
MQLPVAVLGASLALSVAALVSCLVCAVTVLLQARLRLSGEAKLREDMFLFDKRLAYLRVRMERAAEQWRHKADFAEVSLSSFFEFEAILNGIRQRPANATRTFSDYRIPKAGLDARREFLSGLRMRRHVARAWFGDEGGDVYSAVLEIADDVEKSSHLLAEAALLNRDLDTPNRQAHEAVIWAPSDETQDPIQGRLMLALSRAEAVFGPALRPPFQEGAPD